MEMPVPKEIFPVVETLEKYPGKGIPGKYLMPSAAWGGGERDVASPGPGINDQGYCLMTSVNLANHLNLEITDEFCEYGGIKYGVICKTEERTATGLKEHVQSRIGHEVKLIMHGEKKINKGLVAVVAGGGSVGFAVKELAEIGVNMYITGTARHVPGFEPVMEFHRIINEKKINVIGATHYSTEKYACIAMVRYFAKLGIPAKFLEGRYYPVDL